MIDPKDIIAKYSPEEICRGAEAYYAANSDPEIHIQKPFRSFTEASESLEKLGMLLSGLQLGRGMRVLDFGAGTCWISAYLQQLGCRVTACDPSGTALEIGKKRVESNPFIAADSAVYTVFNGRKIDAPDASFDRIVCFDTFHHIPNWEAVLSEFARTLKPGGSIGFKEPGYRHSSAASSQAEMHNHVVLENDIYMDQIAEYAQTVGLDFLHWRTVTTRRFTLSQYHAARRSSFFSVARQLLGRRLFRTLRRGLEDNSIFFLSKGAPALDSRSGESLQAEITPTLAKFSAQGGEPVCLEANIVNRGRAIWLHATEDLIGTVMLGARLYNSNGEPVSLDWARARIPRDIAPGDSVSMELNGPTLPAGSYMVELDMVSEGVNWFAFAPSARGPRVRVELEIV